MNKKNRVRLFFLFICFHANIHSSSSWEEVYSAFAKLHYEYNETCSFLHLISSGLRELCLMRKLDHRSNIQLMRTSKYFYEKYNPNTTEIKDSRCLFTNIPFIFECGHTPIAYSVYPHQRHTRAMFHYASRNEEQAKMLLDVQDADEKRANMLNVLGLAQADVGSLMDFYKSNGKGYLISALTNDLDLLEMLLKIPKIDVNARDINGQTILIYTVTQRYEEYRRIDTLKKLLAVPKIDVNAQDNHGNTPLIYAVEQKNGHELLTILLNVPEINVNLHNEYGITALVNAVCQKNWLNLLNILLSDKRVAVGAKNEFGETILMCALRQNDAPKILEVLLADERIDINAQDNHGNTALMLVLDQKYGPESLKVLLSDRRININATDKQGNTVFMLASNKQNASELLKVLWNAQHNINKKHNERFFFGRGWLDVIDKVVIGELDHQSNIRLICASQVLYKKYTKEIMGCLGKTKVVLAASLFTNLFFPFEYHTRAMFHYASRNEEQAEMLLEVQDADGKRANMLNVLGLAQADVGCVMDFYKDINNNQGYLISALNNDLKLLKIFLTIPEINFNARDRYGRTVLMHAMNKPNNLDLVKALLNVSRININKKDHSGQTALMYAIHQPKALDLVQILLNVREIDVNIQNECGDTVLMGAIFRDNAIDLLMTLLKAPGININAKDSYGNTLLMNIFSIGRRKKLALLKMLLNVSGIDVNAKNKWGENFLAYSLRQSIDSETLKIVLDIPGIDMSVKSSDGQSVLKYAFKQRNGAALLKIILNDVSCIKELFSFTNAQMCTIFCAVSILCFIYLKKYLLYEF